jgi:hypothetical protein
MWNVLVFASGALFASVSGFDDSTVAYPRRAKELVKSGREDASNREAVGRRAAIVFRS